MAVKWVSVVARVTGMDICFLTFTNPHPEKIVLTKEKSTVKEEE